MKPNPNPEPIERFLAGHVFAVLGASRDRGKYGNKVLRCYQQNGRTALPIHPKETSIEGATAYATIAAAPGDVDRASIITPPPVTEKLVPELKARGVQILWMQPGAESEKAIAEAERLGMGVIAGGPCLLVVLGFHA